MDVGTELVGSVDGVADGITLDSLLGFDDGFKLGSDATGMVCKGTPMKKSVIKDHLVACTSPDCGECDPTVQSKWEYWSCGSGGKTVYLLKPFIDVIREI